LTYCPAAWISQELRETWEKHTSEGIKTNSGGRQFVEYEMIGQRSNNDSGKGGGGVSKLQAALRPNMEVRPSLQKGTGCSTGPGMCTPRKTRQERDDENGWPSRQKKENNTAVGHWNIMGKRKKKHSLFDRAPAEAKGEAVLTRYRHGEKRPPTNDTRKRRGKACGLAKLGLGKASRQIGGTGIIDRVQHARGSDQPS